MRNLEELFKNTPRLEAPDTLQRRVMEEIRAHEKERKPGWFDTVADLLRSSLTHPARAGFALATVAVAVAVSIAVNTPGIRAPRQIVQAPDMSQINDYMDETLDDTYAGAWGVNGASSMESDDISDFVATHVESVFWIDGGSDNA
ncbi:MAG: hypothetical protein HQK86_04685 [Nitrospinae bacterium]|nr:hypothetical protein [Nitrospinota bacterium]